jgi:hypothetical protein
LWKFFFDGVESKVVVASGSARKLRRPMIEC